MAWPAWLWRSGSRTLCWLTPTLAIGGDRETRNLKRLAAQGVRAVVDLQAETADWTEQLRRRGLAYRKVPLRDFSAPTLAELDQTTNWILTQMQDGRPVFLHCRLGLGRSATLAIATLMRIGYSLPDAYTLVRRQRPEIALSEAQLQILHCFARRKTSA